MALPMIIKKLNESLECTREIGASIHFALDLLPIGLFYRLLGETLGNRSRPVPE